VQLIAEIDLAGVTRQISRCRAVNCTRMETEHLAEGALQRTRKHDGGRDRVASHEPRDGPGRYTRPDPIERGNHAEPSSLFVASAPALQPTRFAEDINQRPAVGRESP